MASVKVSKNVAFISKRTGSLPLGSIDDGFYLSRLDKMNGQGKIKLIFFNRDLVFKLVLMTCSN